MMLPLILYGIAGVCVLGAIQERKDFMRLFGFLAVGAIFAIVGLVIQFA